MGLLDALKQYVSDSMPGGLLNPEWNKANGQRLAEELSRGLLESTGINARDKRRAWERNKLDAVSGSSDTKASLNQQAYETAMAMAGMAPMGLTVWHGSPHKFDKFDMSKIGTGEGAQAYGHGLYMAESPKVAKGYQASTSYQDQVRQFQKELPDDAGFEELLDMANSGQLTPQSNRLVKALASDDWLGFDYPAQAITAAFRNGKNFEMSPELQAAIREYGNLYKVDIPDEAVARMLDWDKPLSQQAPEVQKSMRNAFNAIYGSEEYGAKNFNAAQGMTGGELVNFFRNREYAAEAMNGAGVPGIRYLDGGSRAGGQGTSNYVLFSDQLPRILEVNGKPTGQTPWASGEWQGLLGQ